MILAIKLTIKGGTLDELEKLDEAQSDLCAVVLAGVKTFQERWAKGCEEAYSLVLEVNGEPHKF